MVSILKADIRDHALYHEARALYTNLYRPGSGLVVDAAEASASPDGRYIIFTGTMVEQLEGTPPTRICRIDSSSGDLRVLTFGPNTDRHARYSPDGRHVAFLSDRHRVGDFQLHLLDPHGGEVRAVGRVDGWVEYFHWSPDGKQILLGVAGHGADVAGSQGAVTTRSLIEPHEPWMPAIETGEEGFQWRRAWVYDLAQDQIRPVPNDGINVWESMWCGQGSLVVVGSAGPGEAKWYGAHLYRVDVHTGRAQRIYSSKRQLGCPSASPAGDYITVIEALCSDRGLVAGDLVLMDGAASEPRRLDTRGVDVTFSEWRSDRHLLVAGHRGFETVVALLDVSSGAYTETWASTELSTGGRYVTVCGVGQKGDFALIAENFLQAPELAFVRSGAYRSVHRFSHALAESWLASVDVQRLTWKAPDGLEIQGWLLKPGERQCATVLDIHGGPVWAWRPRWLGRNALHTLLLLKHGYAVFLPNPRGSTGRGQAFVEHVLGDMGGADTSDFLSGLDFLVREGIADPTRIGVTGGSYGGFMTAWLITQDSRFSAAVTVAPFTNHVSEHLISNLPHFVSLFLQDEYTNASGKYFQRSPIMFAGNVKTPTLSICGALDRATPPEEAAQFHNALLLNGVRSVLVTYPNEGHGIRKLPASLDYAARLVAWFEEHMAVSPKGKGDPTTTEFRRM